MTTLYGIANCDSVRKARKWLDNHQIAYQFHDFRQAGLTQATLQQWLTQVSLEALINKRSTSWRQLTEAQKQDLFDNQNLELILQHPTLIKRPVLQTEQTLQLGFKEADYQKIFTDSH